MGDITEKIKKLVALWYLLVNCDHHKDRDCHWEITHRYSYHGEESWYVSHNGYVHDGIVRDAKSYDQASLILYKELIKAFERQFAHARRISKEECEMLDWNFSGVLELEPKFKEIIRG